MQDDLHHMIAGMGVLAGVEGAERPSDCVRGRMVFGVHGPWTLLGLMVYICGLEGSRAMHTLRYIASCSTLQLFHLSIPIYYIL